MTKREQAIEYLITITKPLCLYPEELKVEDTLEDLSLVLNIKSHKDDLPLLIGKSGKTASALRGIMSVWGVKNIANVSVFVNRHTGTIVLKQEVKQI